MPLDTSDTIAAIASPSGPGLRGLIRLTGPDAWSIALDRFRPDRPGGTPTHPERRPGRWHSDELRRPLTVALAGWPGRRTYTGQPLVEIHLSGSPPILGLVLADCLSDGARLAEPGEFTLRAFLSGRIDLTQAEAVLGVIDARDGGQLEAALKQLAGGLATPIAALRDRLADLLAHLEANLDFAEEPDVDLLGRTSLADELGGAAADILSIADRLRGRDRAGSRPRVVLVGPPNAGKSRLFNALVGGDRAIVSQRAGTTRDYLEAACDCDGLAVDLIDTAGAEPAELPIERLAQKARADQAGLADLLLVCESADAPADPAPVAPGRPRIGVWTKADLAPPCDDGLLATAAATGSGIPALRSAVAAMLRARDVDGDLPAGTGARCRESLTRAGRSLEEAASAVRSGAGDELVAVDIRQAIDDLGRVVGAVVTDDLLDRIFRRFCIGK
ncbi:tRNA modification GTPase [Tundrisphaera sp. TA3]|uniref:tRNA modification GTPase n=1 Tax=Tundrisphaera sp. TA3 TaxID=3435775 RepID=UPI003EBA6132